MTKHDLEEELLLEQGHLNNADADAEVCGG